VSKIHQAVHKPKALPNFFFGLVASVSIIASVSAQQFETDLTGVIDFHVHAGPDSRPREFNDFEAVRLAEEAGLRGVVLKNHFTITSDRAALAATTVDDLKVFGGVALNRAVGGINPEAIRQMVAFSSEHGKVVWLPTFDSEFYVRRAGSNDGFVSVMRNGSVVPELLEVFSLIAQHNLVLAMGHSSPQEVLHLLPIAREMGVENILVTHVFGQNASLEQMQQMASLGAILELDWLEVYSDALDIFAYVDAINTLGADNFLISSDFGQAGNPDHASGMRAFIQALRTAEINSAQIDLMARKNPAILLGLD
jgi:hypothetical protein